MLSWFCSSPLRLGEGGAQKGAPGEGDESDQILRPSPYPLPEGEGTLDYRVAAINDQPMAQNRLPANAHMLRYCFWMRRPAMSGAIICAIDISNCIKPMTMPWRWRAAGLVIRLVRLGRSTALPNGRKTIATNRNVI